MTVFLVGLSLAVTVIGSIVACVTIGLVIKVVAGDPGVRGKRIHYQAAGVDEAPEDCDGSHLAGRVLDSLGVN